MQYAVVEGKWCARSRMESYVLELMKDSRAEVLSPYFPGLPSQCRTIRNTISQSESFLKGFCVVLFSRTSLIHLCRSQTKHWCLNHSLNYTHICWSYPPIHSFLYLTIFIKHLLCARACARHWSATENKTDSSYPDRA